MQTAAVAAPASPVAAFAPSTADLRSPASERVPPYWDEARQDWVGTPTEEEKFAALKALIDEGLRDLDEGRYFEISSFEEFRELIGSTEEEAIARFGGKRTAPYVNS